MSETPAARARSALFQPRSVMSVTRRSTLNRGLGAFAVPIWERDVTSHCSHLSTLFLTSANNWQQTGLKLLAQMGIRGQRVPKFAQFIKQRRGKRSLQFVAARLKEVGVRSGSTALFKYEDEGRIPPIDVIRGLAAVYGVAVAEMLDRLFSELGVQGVDWWIDLPRHTAEALSGSQRGGSVVPASAQARIRELEREISERDHRHKLTVRTMQDVTRRLADALAREGLAISVEDAGTGSDELPPRKGPHGPGRGHSR